MKIFEFLHPIGHLVEGAPASLIWLYSPCALGLSRFGALVTSAGDRAFSREVGEVACSDPFAGAALRGTPSPQCRRWSIGHLVDIQI